jgi:hypothetical protein
MGYATVQARGCISGVGSGTLPGRLPQFGEDYGKSAGVVLVQWP